MNKKQQAFSLIELSIVILVIGILVAGVIQGSKLVQKFQIQTAQTLTQSSPVASINNLVMWLETSSSKSFLENEAVDGGVISQWNDINPQVTNQSNATQTGADSIKPTYIENEVNGLPILRFDGTNDFLDFDGNLIVGSDYTIFIVAKQTDTNDDNWFIGGDNTGAGTSDLNLYYGWQIPTRILARHIPNAGPEWVIYNTTSNNMNYVIHTLRMSQTIGTDLWMNGGIDPDGSNPDANITLQSYANSRIARAWGLYASLDFAEMIMFNRALKNSERQAIESYLSIKYDIAIQ